MHAESLLDWMLEALGLNAVVLPVLGLLLFGGGLLVVLLSRRPAVIAACLAFVPLPLMIGLFGMLHGAVMSFRVIANSVTAPKPAELAEGISIALFTPFVALLFTMPGFLVLALGLLVRTIQAGRNPQSP
jgi:hypothetical protein